MTSQDGVHEVVIIGGGVVGLAVSKALGARGMQCLLCEKEKDLISGASCRNSAIVHSGFDAVPGSIESECLIASRSLHTEFLRKHRLPYEKCGALVVAYNEDEMDKLFPLLARAEASGDEARLLSRDELFEKEPFLNKSALGALWIPSETIVDPWLTPMAMMQEAVHCGAKVWSGAGIRHVHREDGVWRLKTLRGDILAKYVINCAGLHGDDLDKMADLQPQYEIKPRRGQFIVYSKTARPLVNSVIYPVPTPKSKGQLVFPTVYGNVVVGPTAEEQVSKTDRDVDVATMNQLIKKATSVIPRLAEHAVVASYTGLRPATQHRDYIIKHHNECNWLTVAGIRSTGLSSSHGLSERVASIVEASLPHPRPSTHHTPSTPCEHDGLFKANSVLEVSPDGRLGLHLSDRFAAVTHPLTLVGHHAALCIQFPSQL